MQGPILILVERVIVIALPELGAGGRTPRTEVDVTTYLPPLSPGRFSPGRPPGNHTKEGEGDSHSLVLLSPTLYGVFGFAKDVVRRQNGWRGIGVSLPSPNTRLSQKIAGVLSWIEQRILRMRRQFPISVLA
jgi:hypothetical protein